VLLGGIAAVAYVLLVTPMYTSTAQFFVSTQGTASTSDALQGSEFSQQRAASYAELLDGPLLLTRVVERLDLDVTPRALGDRIGVTAVPETVLIDLAVQDSSPAGAQRIADVLGEEFIERVAELEGTGAEDPAAVRVTVAEPAGLPAAPTSPSRLPIVAMGLMGGMVAGGALALVRARLDTSVKDPEEAAALAGVPILGLVRHDDSAGRSRATEHDRASLAAEDFRRLRTNLQYLRAAGDIPRVIMVVSPMPSEGKTTAVLNLALVLADAGRRVTVVDADLRRPTVASSLGLVQGVGLTQVLTGAAQLDDVTQRFGEDGFTVVGSGPTPPDPGALLASANMATLIEKLRAENDFVLVDAPPLLPVADASALAAHVDGVLLTVRYGSTGKAQLQRAAVALEQVDANTLGLVINMVPSRAEEVGGGYSYS
jgi:receptor protein-tyrosine kinase